MLLAIGERRYADEMERVLYNAIAVAVAEDGKHFFYSKPLQLRTGHDGSDEDAPSRRLSWYSCFCCPPNIARLMASLHGYLATADDGGLRIHMYSSGVITASGLRVSIRTEYPWDGRVELTVSGTGALSLRIPAWCEHYSINVDATETDGYLRLDGDWGESIVVVLDLEMAPQVVAAHPHVDAVRGCVALARGPLVYCIEQADLPQDVVLEDVRVDPTAPLVMSIRNIIAQGSVVHSTMDLYHGYTVPSEASSPLTVTAVPYFLWGNRTPGAMRVWIPIAP